MTVFVLAREGTDDLASETRYDAGFVNASAKVVVVPIIGSPIEQLTQVTNIPFESGDIVCFAGICPRPLSFQIANIAKERKENFMPGRGIDHRGIDIAQGKIQHRQAIEKNFQQAWPYVMCIGDPESARLSFELVKNLDPAVYWSEYQPETYTLEHLLSVASVVYNWQVPRWFSLVDLSLRDLELAPIMYASHKWDEWVSFYPSNGNFKLENHVQLSPVWLAGSVKPLGHWKRV